MREELQAAPRKLRGAIDAMFKERVNTRKQFSVQKTVVAEEKRKWTKLDREVSAWKGFWALVVEHCPQQTVTKLKYLWAHGPP